MRFVSNIKPAAKGLVVFNGSAHHTDAGAQYHQMLHKLALRRDIHVTLLVPDDRARDCVAKVAGNLSRIGWYVVKDPAAASIPPQLLVLEEGGTYSGLGFDNNSMARNYNHDAAAHLWNHHAPRCGPLLVNA